MHSYAITCENIHGERRGANGLFSKRAKCSRSWLSNWNNNNTRNIRRKQTELWIGRTLSQSAESKWWTWMYVNRNKLHEDSRTTLSEARPQILIRFTWNIAARWELRRKSNDSKYNQQRLNDCRGRDAPSRNAMIASNREQRGERIRTVIFGLSVRTRGGQKGAWPKARRIKKCERGRARPPWWLQVLTETGEGGRDRFPRSSLGGFPSGSWQSTWCTRISLGAFFTPVTPFAGFTLRTRQAGDTSRQSHTALTLETLQWHCKVRSNQVLHVRCRFCFLLFALLFASFLLLHLSRRSVNLSSFVLDGTERRKGWLLEIYVDDVGRSWHRVR